MLQRLYNDCLLSPQDMKPSHDTLEVVGTFNPGAIATDEGVTLLVRVAERPIEQRPGFTGLPRWEPDTGLVVDWLANDALDFIDPRVVEVKATGAIRLTFISHIAVAHCRDGRAVDRIEPGRFKPATEYETYGVEDPRLTLIEGRYYFTYVAVSPHGACTALASTVDFRHFERHGIIFPCENKDVLLFPEKVNGEYLAFHRPNPSTHFCPPEMWLAHSADLTHWGRHEAFHCGGGQWETGRIGGGCPPFRTERGWVEIYHGNERAASGVGAYAAGALLLDIENPQIILGRATEPLMQPETSFEREGFVPNVVFPTGVVQRDALLQVYYGAADACTGFVEFSLNELLENLA